MLYENTVLNSVMKPAAPPVLRATRLLDQVRERIRYKHYSLRTEQAYVQWVRVFVKWHGLRHPRDMGQLEIESFLAMLANERRVAAATHNQALSALLFLYREVLGMDLPWLDGVQRPRTPKRIPSVLTVAEVAALLSALPADMALLARLLYGTGMRLMEGLRLRVKDLDFDRGVVVVRQAKGDKDRVVMLPRSLAAELHQQVLAARAVGARPASAARWRGRSACTGDKISRHGTTLGMVLGVPRFIPVCGPAHRCVATPSPLRGAITARTEEGRCTGGHLQTRFGAHLAPQLRHTLVAVGHRHSHGAGVAGALGREHDDDLYPCP